MRDDPGRSPQIELEPERSFDGPLSGQSVYEQTSGTKSRNRTGRQALEQKSRAPPARPSDDITAQSHSVPCGQSVSDIQVRTLRTGQSQTPEAMTQ